MTSLALRLLDLAVAAFALVYLVRPQDFLRSGPADDGVGTGSTRERDPEPGRAPRETTGDRVPGDGETRDPVPAVGFVDRAVLFGEDPSAPSPLEPGRILGLVVVLVGLALAFGLL